MKTIWKFDLEVTDLQDIAIPEGARLLCVQIQRRQPKLWALVEEFAPIVKRFIEMVGTGHEVSDPVGAYIGTFQNENGSLVFHVFDNGEGT